VGIFKKLGHKVRGKRVRWRKLYRRPVSRSGKTRTAARMTAAGERPNIPAYDARKTWAGIVYAAKRANFGCTSNAAEYQRKYLTSWQILKNMD
jgi:hypothetical protein